MSAKEVGAGPACFRLESRAGKENKMKVRQAESNTESTGTDHPARAELAKMKTPPVVSPDEWIKAREEMVVRENEVTRARDALAAERRRMPWMAVEKKYVFDGPNGTASLLDLFDGRQQLVIYRAFFEPGVYGWPDHACRG